MQPGANARPPVPIGQVPVIRPEPLTQQQKNLIVHNEAMQLCAVWVSFGQDRPSIEDVQKFYRETVATIREHLGWKD